MRIALAQITASADPAENLTLLEQRTAQAAAQGAQLVVFPEASMRRFGLPLGPVAEPLEGPWASRVRQVAQEHAVTIAAGMFTPGADGKVENTLLVTGPTCQAAYRKIHLYDAFGFKESDTVAHGTEPVTVEVGAVTVGLSICYDLRFPALYQELADRGADLILAVASWGAGEGKGEQWNALVRARALDSGCFVAAVDQAPPTAEVPGAGTAPLGVGLSAVVDPLGRTVGQLGRAPGMLVLDVPTEDAADMRAATGALANRRQFTRAG